MKTTISVQVKNESIITKATSSLLWFIRIFQKSKVLVSVNDGEPFTLTASKEFQEIPVEPGHVVLQFADPRAKSKERQRKLTGAFIGGAFGLGSGSSGGALAGMAAGSSLGKLSIKEDILECDLNEGDNLKISCKCTGKGQVKIKVVK